MQRLYPAIRDDSYRSRRLRVKLSREKPAAANPLDAHVRGGSGHVPHNRAARFYAVVQVQRHATAL